MKRGGGTEFGIEEDLGFALGRLQREINDRRGDSKLLGTRTILPWFINVISIGLPK